MDMKYMKNILGTMFLTAVVTASCVDDKPLAFDVEKPASIAGMEYLNDYDVLKSYVGGSANPDFKLGIALAASDYIAGGQVTQLANSNFMEMTAGNAMKHASCVQDDGTMNFGTVESFVSAAKAGGLTIYGHTLAWHSQQNIKYLNSLLEDKELDIDPDAKVYVNQITNSEMAEGQPMSNFVVREPGKGDIDGPVLAGEGPEGMNCTKVTSHANPANSWDTQFFIYTPDKAWKGGERYRISFWYKASAEASCETQCHGAPGAYMHWACLPQNPKFTTEWQKYEATFTIPGEGNGMKSIAFNLNVDKENAITYYFADFVVQSEEKGNTIPLTPEEKKDTLTWAMNNWVEGMMKATAGYVTAWDVVNEAVSGGGDEEGFYTLQSAKNVSADEAKNNFYWQDYLGNEDYARIAVAAARKYYAENGGTAPLKLFVNDYNLESDWDDNKKAKSLVYWIGKWEADGVTKIDGIGTQMHVSCYANPDVQKSKEEHVVKMFEILAASGKLVKISELDMGYVDENGNSVKTENMTEAQHKAMAEYYKFIVKKYFELIPAAQRYGITQWCATDAPGDSGWRGGEPVGLWDSNYNRKHTYAGFADGLAGK